jgi:glycosyltransferase involved in cell wall biosynthesis
MSVVICTYNPRPDYLDEVLACLRAQKADFAWELVIIDNNSSPPVADTVLQGFTGVPGRVVVETRQGLTYARCAGIAVSRAPLICFVDDDNFLAPDYLSAAMRAASDHPETGVFGGRALGRLEAEPDPLVRHYLPFLGVRDLGDEPLIGSGAQWGPWEPIGAGIVVRRDVAEAFADFVERTGGAFGLGRTGDALLSGEDSLISRIADQMGYCVGYFPDLRLTHAMPADRLTREYIFKLLEAQGRTHVILEMIAGREPEQRPSGRLWTTLARRFMHRMKSPGLAEARGHLHWDRGFFQERESQLARRAAKTGPDALKAACRDRIEAGEP